MDMEKSNKKVCNPLEEGMQCTLFESVGDPILVVDQETRKFVEANAAACKHLGRSREEILRLGPVDIDDADSASKVAERMALLKRDGEATFEAVQVRADGTHVSVEMHTHRYL